MSGLLSLELSQLCVCVCVFLAAVCALLLCVIGVLCVMAVKTSGSLRVFLTCDV